jgi:DNA (cytosine-5)-methyltransferase 1
MSIPENKQINHIFTRHSDKMIEQIKALPEGQSLYGNYSDAWKKSPWDKPSCTVKENHGGVNIHPKLPRVLTPRELAALQSFPDDFIFQGTKKWQLVQIGNAVPVGLGEAIGKALIATADAAAVVRTKRFRGTSVHKKIKNALELGGKNYAD